MNPLVTQSGSWVTLSGVEKYRKNVVYVLALRHTVQDVPAALNLRYDAIYGDVPAAFEFNGRKQRFLFPKYSAVTNTPRKFDDSFDAIQVDYLDLGRYPSEICVASTFGTGHANTLSDIVRNVQGYREMCSSLMASL